MFKDNNKDIRYHRALFRLLSNRHHRWEKGFKSGLSKFCERQPLKNLKGYA